jgi:hypothetical protein
MSDKEQSEANGRDKLREAIAKGFGAGETSPPPPESLPSDGNYESPASYGSGNQGAVSEPFTADYQEYTVTLPEDEEDDPDDADNEVVEQIVFDHPFKVSPNGDDTVNVAPGNVIDFTTSGNGIYDSNAVTGDFNAYAGGGVTITASGTLFLVITYDNTNVIALDPTFYVANYALTVTSMEVKLDPALSNLELSIPIAEVDLTDGVVSVTNQILTHNPILQLGFAEGLTP